MSRFHRVIVLLMAAVLLLPAIPALAADNASVLTGIGHRDTNTAAISGSARDVTLTVPYDSALTAVDLTNGLTITYDETKYKSVVVMSAGVVTVGDGSYASVTVSYNAVGDAAGAAAGSTIYRVFVNKAAKKESSFSGVINKSVKAGELTLFSPSDFLSAGNYSKNDGNGIAFIRIRGSNLAAGTLSYSGGEPFGIDIPLSAGSEFPSQMTFSALNCGVVSYYVDAYESGAAAPFGTAVLTVTVYDIPVIQSACVSTVYKSSTLRFSASAFAALCDLRGANLAAVEITPTDNSFGTWYKSGMPQAAGTPFEVPAGDLSALSFTGTAEGAAEFSFRIKNAAGFSAGEGSGTITVTAATITLSSYTGSAVTRGDTWTVSASHFNWSPASLPITFLKITSIPAAADGYLCLTTALAKSADYGYPAIAANAALAAGAVIPSGYIPYLRLVTKSTGTGASVSFGWTATAGDSAASAVWAAAATYTVNFTTAGTLRYDADMNIPLALDASDFTDAFTANTGYSLSYVLFTLPAAAVGKLYYDYNIASGTGTAVSAAVKYYPGSSPNLSHITFVPASGYIGSAEIAYKACRADGAGLSGTLVISVSNSAGGVVSYTMDKNDSLPLDAADFSAAFLDATGQALSYVKFALPSYYVGQLYYNYTSPSNFETTVSSGTKYYVLSPSYLSYVSFVPRENYTGAVTISFTGYTAGGTGYGGKLIIFVVDSPGGIVSYTTPVGGTVALSGGDFADEFIGATGSVLSYVVFTPPDATVGTLYYDYSAASGEGTAITAKAKTKYYNGANPAISKVTFVPAKDFTGRAEIGYTVYTAAGVSYAGKLKITVGQGSSGSVSYSADYNTPVTFRASDFIARFFSNTGGGMLSYVTFTPPSTTYGRLYYGYLSPTDPGSAVTSGAKYYAGMSPYLSSVTFVPRDGYSGSFTLSYTGYTADGKAYPGKIAITIGGGAAVYYAADSLDGVTFAASDFSGVFKDATGRTLSYVKFSLPAASAGMLYYGYTSSGGSASAVSSSVKYYAGTYPSVSNVTFVPAAGFSGTVTFGYTAYDSGGASLEGTVAVSVSGTGAGTVSYHTDKNTPVSLDGDDFNSALYTGTGASLYSVKFTLPASERGVLWYDYAAASGTGTKVTESARYYRAQTPLLSHLTFVPAKGFEGDVTISYVAYTSSGKAYGGTLEIAVGETYPNPFGDVDSGYSWAERAVSYLYAKKIVEGYSGGLFYPGQSISRGDFVLMVCRAFDLETPSSGGFSDVPADSYYYDAVCAAKTLGIVEGNGDRFYPETPLTRQDAAVIIARTLETAGNPLSAAPSGALSGVSDSGSISDYAEDAMAALWNAGILEGNGGRLNPTADMTRAEMAVILYRVVTGFIKN